LATLNSGAPAERTRTFTQVNLWKTPGANIYYTTYESFTLTVRGTIVPTAGPWDNRSNSIANGLGYGWFMGGEQLVTVPPQPGPASTAFGYVFPGSANPDVPAPTEVYFNVPVTPGQTYQIIVDGGNVTLNFLQP
jgi:multidrug efflux pump subunit AcrA (membrane-fusion protein)